MALYQMSPEHKGKLQGNRVYLIENIEPSERLLSYLLQERVLTEDMYEEIDVERLRKRKVGKLLDILPRRGPVAFQHFINGLMKDDQECIAECLDPDLVAQWNSVHPKLKPGSHNPYPGQQPLPVPQSHQSFQPKSFFESEESGFFNPEVKSVDVSDKNIIKLIRDTKKNYTMSSKPRGRAIIINNSYFVNNSPRDGAAFDSQNICTHLEQLYFDVKLYADLTAMEMKQIFRDEGSQRDHSDEDCFFAFVLSHGARGYVYGTDGRKLSIEDDMVTPLCGDSCPSLLNKPKVFFIQACQGDEATEGVALPSGDQSEVDAVPVDELGQAIEDLHIKDSDKQMPHMIHEKSDVVLAYSTVPGYRSWRRTDLGSWFVRAIIKVFAAEAYQEDLLSLLVKVRETVSEYHTKHENHSFVQLTRTDETTRKKIYLFPGYYEKNRASFV